MQQSRVFPHVIIPSDADALLLFGSIPQTDILMKNRGPKQPAQKAMKIAQPLRIAAQMKKIVSQDRTNVLLEVMFPRQSGPAIAQSWAIFAQMKTATAQTATVTAPDSCQNLSPVAQKVMSLARRWKGCHQKRQEIAHWGRTDRGYTSDSATLVTLAVVTPVIACSPRPVKGCPRKAAFCYIPSSF